jgi:pilus assembly protein CpaF
MAASPRLVVRESPAQAARRLGLTTLVDRVADAMDLAPLSGPVDDALSSRVQQAVKAQADAMKAEGEVPGGLDLSVLVADATRELTGLGAVAPLLEDDEVAEIHCTRHDQIVCIKGGQSQLADVAFSSDAALGRVIARLARLSGQAVGAGEVVVERHLPRGAHMLAFIPPASMGHALVVRKRRRVDMSMEDFVRLAAMSRPMVAFLEQCLAARANVLVSAPQAALAGTFLGALTTASAAGERVALLLEHEDVPVSHAQVLALAGNEQTREQLLRAAARTRPDRLVVGTLTGPLVAAALEAVAEGAEGVLASVCAPSLRQALTRMVAQLVLSRPGLGTEAARELVGESFDIALEVTLFGDGRMRVNRLAELAGSDAKGIVARDLFVADGEGHTATGVVPRALGEFAARGVKVDANLFKKGR